ncbi:MAG: hypothetical protein Fur0012_03360 [Elusimicrobiota bacterium]
MRKFFLKNISKKDLAQLTGQYRINHLFIYINTSCNLSCKYCKCSFLNEKINNSILEEKTFIRGLNAFLKASCSNPEFTFYGGEPLIYQKKLMLYSEIIRKKLPYAPINIFTNGILLDQKIADFARKLDINFLVSIDGDRQTTDSNRRLLSGGSAYEKILAGLKKADMFERLTANMVLTMENISGWGNNIRHLENIGFESVNWDINYLDNWTPQNISAFSLELKKLLAWHIRELASGSRFKFSNLYRYLSPSVHKKQSASITLLNDGKFYFCDLAALSELPGVDMKKLNGFISAIGEKGLSLNELYCGMGLYLYLHLKGKSDYLTREKIFSFRQLKREHERILSVFARIIRENKKLLSSYENPRII